MTDAELLTKVKCALLICGNYHDEMLKIYISEVKDFDTAEAGDVVAIFANLNDYVVNTNMQITTTRWIDNNSNEIKNKALMICDGKLADPNGVLIIKKAANSTG